MRVFGFGNRQFYKEECEECENRCLDESDKHFKKHEWHWQNVRDEMRDHENENLAGKDVSKKTEGK